MQFIIFVPGCGFVKKLEKFRFEFTKYKKEAKYFSINDVLTITKLYAVNHPKGILVRRV